MTTMMILSPSGLLLGLGSLAVYAWTKRKRPKSSSSGTTTAPPKNLPPPPPSPFVPGSSCTQTAGVVEVMKWVQEVVQPVLQSQIEAYDVPTDAEHHDEARQALIEITDDVYAMTVPECGSHQTSATRKVWKALWCEAAFALVNAGKLDEELDDLIALCMDESFDPRAPKPPVEPPLPKPPLPPFPMPMDGSAAPGPMDGAIAGPPANVWVASSRKELSELGAMRLMEGTAGGAPIMGPAARVVMLAFNPVWPGIEAARADMQRLAAEHPGVSFVEVSFADTQRHFGKPRDVNGIMWALAAGAPDGRVFSTPIARHDPRDAPPTAAQWNQLIAHASGFVGFGRARTIVRPRRFGDFVRAIARTSPAVPKVVPKGRSARPPSRMSTTRRRSSKRRGG